MTRIVVDASALIEYLFRSRRGREVELALRAPGADLHVPALCDVEVASALRRVLLRHRIELAHAAAVLDAYRDLPVTRHGHRRLLERMLVLRANFTAYDAAYAALAEALDAALLTADERLSAAARQHLDVPLL